MLQVKLKAAWVARATGMTEDEEELRRRYRLTRHTGVRETPKDKTGNKQARREFSGPS